MCGKHYDIWISLTRLCTVIKHGIVLVTVRHKFKCPTVRNSSIDANSEAGLTTKTIVKITWEQTQTDVLKTNNLLKFRSSQENSQSESVAFSIFVHLSVFRFPQQAHFIFILATSHVVVISAALQNNWVCAVPLLYFRVFLGSLCSPSQPQTISHCYLPKARMLGEYHHIQMCISFQAVRFLLPWQKFSYLKL